MAAVEQVDAGTVVSGYLAGSEGRDSVLMAAADGGHSGVQFDGAFMSWDVGGLAGCDVVADRPTRASGQCAWPADAHMIGVLVEGSAAYEDDAVTRPIPTASVVAYPANAPFIFHFDDDFRYVIVKVTADDLGVSRGSMSRLVGPRVVEPSPFASAVAALLGDSSAWTGRELATDLQDETIRLLRLMVKMSDERSFGVNAGGQHAVVLDWIEDHLFDPLLDPERIAAAQHISVRQLHRLFADVGVTCRRYLVRRRLEHVRSDLIGSGLDLATIGVRWGMPDPAYVAKAFKREFGMAPRAIRHSGFRAN